MKSILKYSIEPIPGVHKIQIRSGAILRKVANQNELVTFWYEVDTNIDTEEEQTFVFFMTGDMFTNHNFVYLDSLLLQAGSHVLHIYNWLKN